MHTEQQEQRLDNLERRVDRIEQILPTLATKHDLKTAVAPLATKAELKAVKTELQTAFGVSIADAVTASERRMCARMDAIAESLRDDIRLIADGLTETEQRMRTHFDVVAESLRDDIRLLAEAVAGLVQRDDPTA